MCLILSMCESVSCWIKLIWAPVCLFSAKWNLTVIQNRGIWWRRGMTSLQAIRGSHKQCRNFCPIKASFLGLTAGPQIVSLIHLNVNTAFPVTWKWSFSTSHKWTDRLHADTLTSRKAMAADLLVTVEPGDWEAVCSCGEGGMMGKAGPLWLVRALLLWNSICCNVRLRFGWRRQWVWLKISTATHFITPATRSSYSGMVYILEVYRQEVSARINDQ